MRVQKYLSEQGIASRREAEQLIKRGLVSINGVVVREMGVQIDPAKDKVAVLPHAMRELAQKKAVIIYKPRDIASSREHSEGKTIYDLFPEFESLDIIGRLDKASEGLLLLSNDGVLARAVTGQEHTLEKEYTVSVREEVNAGLLKSLEPGVTLDADILNGAKTKTLPCKTQLIDIHTFRIILHEGKKHQIRRMCEHLHLTVVQLKRIRIGTITIEGLRNGQFRQLTPEEIASLKHRP